MTTKEKIIKKIDSINDSATLEEILRLSGQNCNLGSKLLELNS